MLAPSHGALIGALAGGGAGFVLCQRLSSPGGARAAHSANAAAASDIPKAVEGTLAALEEGCKHAPKPARTEVRDCTARLCACLSLAATSSANPADVTAKALLFRHAASDALSALASAMRPLTTSTTLTESVRGRVVAMESLFQKIVSDVVSLAGQSLYRKV